MSGWTPTGERRVGGSAEVVAVVDARGRRGALKRARTLAATPTLLRERDTLHAIAAADPDAHRWSVTLWDEGVDADGRPWFVLPWCDHNLRSWVTTTAPRLDVLLGALQEAATAVWRLHTTGQSLGQPRLHGDLKPENFLVDRGSVRLADYGGTRALGLTDRAAPIDAYTPRYAPPEQSLGCATRPDPSVDAHALAVSFYALITGFEPDSRRAPLPLTRQGERLVALRGVLPTSPAEEEERARLAAEPVSALVELDDMEALRATDLHRLSAAVRDEVGGATDPDALAERITALLVDALVPALQPDPVRREGDLRPLIAACEAARRALAEAGMGQAPSVVDAGFAVRAGVVAATPNVAGLMPPVDEPPRATSPRSESASASASSSPLTALPTPPPTEPEEELRADPVLRPLMAVLGIALLGAAVWALLRAG